MIWTSATVIILRPVYRNADYKWIFRHLFSLIISALSTASPWLVYDEYLRFLVVYGWNDFFSYLFVFYRSNLRDFSYTCCECYRLCFKLVFCYLFICWKLAHRRSTVENQIPSHTSEYSVRMVCLLRLPPGFNGGACVCGLQNSGNYQTFWTLLWSSLCLRDLFTGSTQYIIRHVDIYDDRPISIPSSSPSVQGSRYQKAHYKSSTISVAFVQFDQFNKILLGNEDFSFPNQGHKVFLLVCHRNSLSKHSCTCATSSDPDQPTDSMRLSRPPWVTKKPLRICSLQKVRVYCGIYCYSHSCLLRPNSYRQLLQSIRLHRKERTRQNYVHLNGNISLLYYGFASTCLYLAHERSDGCNQENFVQKMNDVYINDKLPKLLEMSRNFKLYRTS